MEAVVFLAQRDLCRGAGVCRRQLLRRHQGL